MRMAAMGDVRHIFVRGTAVAITPAHWRVAQLIYEGTEEFNAWNRLEWNKLPAFAQLEMLELAHAILAEFQPLPLLSAVAP